MTGAVADCERILDGFLGQPVNAITSLAFVVAGFSVLFGGHHRRVATALVATGIGSFLFHGPMWPGSQWAHDVSLLWLLLVAGGVGTRWETWSGWPTLVSLAVLLGALPGLADPLAVVVTTVAITGILWRSRTVSTWTALGLLGLGGLIGRLSATDGPWCRPNSLLQGHAVWHLAAAVAVVTWVSGEGTDPPTGVRSG